MKASIKPTGVYLRRLKQRYDLLTELQNLGIQLTLCKFPVHIRVERNEEADKAAKQTIDIPEMTTTTLLPDHQRAIIQHSVQSHNENVRVEPPECILYAYDIILVAKWS